MAGVLTGLSLYIKQICPFQKNFLKNPARNLLRHLSPQLFYVLTFGDSG